MCWPPTAALECVCQVWTLFSHFRDEEREAQSSSLAQEVTADKVVFEEGLWRMWADKERREPGVCGCGL